MGKRNPKPGFTLVEILVILAIIAVLAGVLVPAVANQITKGEATRLISDLENVRTGVETFVSDVKRFPKDIDDLVNKPGSAETDLNGTTYASGLLAKWAGPYLDILMNDDDSVETGYGAHIKDNLDTVKVNGIKYLTVRINTVPQKDFYRLDEAIDTDTSSTAGRLRWFSGDSVKFLAMPINY